MNMSTNVKNINNYGDKNINLISNFEYNYINYAYDTNKFKQLLNEFFNSRDTVLDFIKLMNQKHVYISGSSIMKVISNDDYKISDLDIYIDITKFNDGDIKNLLISINDFMKKSKYYTEKEFNLEGLHKKNKFKFLSRYIDYKYSRKHKNIYQRELKKYCRINRILKDSSEYKKIIGTRWYAEPKNVVKYGNRKNFVTNNDKFLELRKNIMAKSKVVCENHANYCLRGHLLDYYKFAHANSFKNIEIMFISKPIDEFMITTFDLSIVQNYYSMGKIYCNALDDIRNKKANISFAHFYRRILYSSHEFNNFLTRYNKYTERGYQIYVGGLKMNDDIVSYIKNIRLSKDEFLNIKSDIYRNTYIERYGFKYPGFNKNQYIIVYLITKILIQKYKKNTLEQTQEPNTLEQTQEPNTLEQTQELNDIEQTDYNNQSYFNNCTIS